MDGIASILVVDDNPKYLADALPMYGYDVTVANDGLEALKILDQKEGAFDLILLDVMMPNMDGWDTLKAIRSNKKIKYIPVIMITAVSEDQKVVSGLRIGADDYIVKPFEMLEVMVRLEKVLERNGTVQEQIQIGDVIIDTASRTVTKMGMEIYLKPMEYNCLMVFAKNPNKALTRNQILQELWNEEFCGETRTVDAHVGRIRKKLGWQDKIKTIPRIGYRLEVDL